MSVDMRDVTVGLTLQLNQRGIMRTGDIYFFSDDSYAKFSSLGQAVFCSGEVRIGDSKLTEIIARELAKPQTFGIATHSIPVFEYLLSQGLVAILGADASYASLGPQIGSIGITAVSVPAGDPDTLAKLKYIAGSRKPGADVDKMPDTQLLSAQLIPIRQIQKVPEALLALPFMQPNAPLLQVSIKERLYELFV